VFKSDNVTASKNARSRVALKSIQTLTIV